MNNLEIALSYLAKGLSVIPLYGPEMLRVSPPKTFIEELKREYEKNEKSENPLSKETITRNAFIKKCKSPCIKGWKEFQNRLPTKEEVTDWFTQNPSANIAIITGVVSNLVVFDLDSEEAVQYAEEQGGFPEYTVKAKTGRGYHVYMKHPGFDVSNKVNKDLDIDIRADGGYVAAPPSVHGSGHQYEWEEGFSISQIDPAPCSPWMIDYLQDISRNDPVEEKQTEPLPEKPETIRPDDQTTKGTTEVKPKEPKAQETNRNEYVDLLHNGCDKKRNNSATSLIGYLLKTGMKETEVWEVIQLWNEHKVKPSLDHGELKKTFDSVVSMERKNKTTTTTAPKIEIDSLLDNQEKTIDEFKQNYVRIPFANTNLTNLENMMSGGFAGGRFYLFGGIPSAGKTVLLNNIADNICLNGYPVLFLSFDDGKSELRHRTFSRFSKHPIEEFNLRTIRDIQSICQLPTIKQIIPLKYVVERSIPVERWSDLIDQIKQKHGKAPVIIIDYLRKLRTEKSIGDERLRVDDILSRLTEIAKVNNTPVIAISELARDSYKSGQRLSMASFKESGTIEYEASWLGILAAVEVGKNGEYIIKENWDSIIKQDGNIDLIIFKAKRGTGATGRVSLKVNKNQMIVSDRTVEPAMIKKTKTSQFE